MKTLEDFQKEVAQKHNIGTKLVTGHKKAYFDEATYLYIKYLNIYNKEKQKDK